MGKLKIIKTGPMTSIQDFGRVGFRKYGIPQSGAMDRDWMIAVNRLVGNSDEAPVVEFSLLGLELEVLEEAILSVVGAMAKVNGKPVIEVCELRKGDRVHITPPTHVYAYFAISGLLAAQDDFGSYSTYAKAGFGGIEGRNLKAGDFLVSEGKPTPNKEIEIKDRHSSGVAEIKIMKGPEWGTLKELPRFKTFQIDPSSDRMGIRLTEATLECDYHEIASSAVIPGVIQLPADGHPIILMNDCQTTGGYPRIGKVKDEELGKLAQLRPGAFVKFYLE